MTDSTDSRPVSPFRDPTPELELGEGNEQLAEALASMHRYSRQNARAIYESQNDTDERLDGLADKVNEVGDSIQRVEELLTGRGTKRQRTASHTTEEGRGEFTNLTARAPPPFLKPIEHVYAFMEEKNRRAAIAGTLKPELLYTLIEHNHSFHKEVLDKRALDVDVTSDGTTVLSLATTKDEKTTIKKFMTGIPNFHTFSFAWSQLTTLMCYGLGDSRDVVPLMRCMNEYLIYIADATARYTWESLCRFHLRVMGPIFAAGGSNPHIWDQWNDARAVSLLEARALRTAPAPTNRASATRGNRARSTASTNQPAPTETAICRLYNNGLCKSKTCPRGRRHVCSGCGKAHMHTECKA